MKLERTTLTNGRKTRHTLNSRPHAYDYSLQHNNRHDIAMTIQVVQGMIGRN